MPLLRDARDEGPMRRRTIREILHRECRIRGEGFGLASIAREGAVELRELAQHFRRLKAATRESRQRSTRT